MSLIEGAGEHWNSPIEVVERMATDNELPFERAVQDEIALVVSGKLTDYQISFTWMNEIEVLHLACAFEMKVPEPLPRGAAAHRHDQRAVVDRTFRRLDAERHGDVSPCPVAGRRRRPVRPAVRGDVRQRDRHLRTLLPGVPVRDLGGQIGARGHGCRHVRDLRRGVTDSAAAQLSVAPIVEYTHAHTLAGLI